MLAAWTEEAVSVKVEFWAGGRSRARVRKVAISARVTARSGQKWVLAGGLQPLVTSEAARPLMLASWTDPSSSVKAPRPFPPAPTAVADQAAPLRSAAAMRTAKSRRLIRSRASRADH